MEHGKPSVEMKGWFGRAGLYVGTGLLAGAFAGRALYRRGRGTHTYGVGARGKLRIVDNPNIPSCEFFKSGRVFPLQIRHATALRKDEASKDFRSIALKFSHEAMESPLDLVMNTGRSQGFWNVPNFLLGIVGGALGKWGRRWYMQMQPPAFQNVNAGIRRAPESFSQLEYYAAISFGYHAKDSKDRLCRFRVIPANREEESGLPDEEDLKAPWDEARRPDESKSMDHLRREYSNRLKTGETIRYWLQIQIHELTPDDKNDIYNIGQEWSTDTHPWTDLGELIIEDVLPSPITESLRFRITHQPEALSIPEAVSPSDYRSIAWMRSRIYPILQAWRAWLQRLRIGAKLGNEVQWDEPQVRERKHFHKPHTQTFVIPLTENSRNQVRGLLDDTYDDWFHFLPAIPSLHYLRIFVVDVSGDPHLLINTTYDGITRDDLDELIHFEESLFRSLLLAAGAPEGTPHVQREWLLQFTEPTKTFYIGGVNQSKDNILREEALRKFIQKVLDEHEDDLRQKPCESIRLFLKESILEQQNDELAEGARRSLPLPARIRKVMDIGLSLASPVSGLLIKDIIAWVKSRESILLRLFLYIMMAIWGLYTVIPTLLLLLFIRYLERTESVPEDATVDEKWLSELEGSENLRLQNNLTMYAPVRQSAARRWIIRILLSGAERGSRHLWAEGRLTGIDTIHFARLLLLDKGRWMLFMSDYDGSWSRYLGDFLTVGKRAVVPIWANLAGCPKTKWLFNPTPGFGGKFMRLTRSRQIKPLLWFSAYPNMSMVNIRTNAALRDGLFQEQMTEAEACEWLALLNA